MHVGYALRAVRESRAIRQDAAAEAARRAGWNITASGLSRVENGHVDAKLWNVAAYLQEIGSDFEEFGRLLKAQAPISPLPQPLQQSAAALAELPGVGDDSSTLKKLVLELYKELESTKGRLEELESTKGRLEELERLQGAKKERGARG